jgi:hypothetical protein
MKSMEEKQARILAVIEPGGCRVDAVFTAIAKRGHAPARGAGPEVSPRSEVRMTRIG